MPNDVAKCTDDRCPFRGLCYRFQMEVVDEKRQVYADFERGEEKICEDGFLPTEQATEQIVADWGEIYDTYNGFLQTQPWYEKYGKHELENIMTDVWNIRKIKFLGKDGKRIEPVEMVRASSLLRIKSYEREFGMNGPKIDVVSR